MRDIELVVLDMAGTTVGDNGEVPRAFVRALAGRGIHVTPEQVANVRGSSKREAIGRFLPAASSADDVEMAYTAFREHLARIYREDGVKVVPGAEAALHTIRQRGIRVALNTGFDRDITTLILAALGWRVEPRQRIADPDSGDGIADAIVCGDDVPRGRPAPFMIFRAMEATGTVAVRRVVNIGDTTLDLEAGHNAGVAWNVGVLTGAHDRARLEQAPHTHILNSIADLPALLACDVDRP
jgi:phosphonatase-like hydrolase